MLKGKKFDAFTLTTAVFNETGRWLVAVGFFLQTGFYIRSLFCLPAGWFCRLSVL